MSRTSEPLELLDLFSGIGGFSLGLEESGEFETVAFCEISDKCRHLLKHHWPEVPAYDDICTLTAERLAAAGISVRAICGGFPCQDLSLAGKGAGLAGQRSGLWREYARLIRELRPEVVIVENVAALLGRGLGDVLGDLAALGYHAWWDCLPASAVGAPHRRDRLWLIAYPGSLEHQGFGDALRREIAAQFPGAYSDAHRQPDQQQPRCVSTPQGPVAGWRGHGPGGVGEDLSDAPRDGRVEDDQHVEGQARSRAPAGQPAGGHAAVNRLWSTEPDVGGALDGFSRWLDETAGDGEAHKVILAYANASEAGPRKALRDLRDRICAEDDRRKAGGSVGVCAEAVLLAFLRKHARRAEEGLSSLEGAPASADSLRGVRRAAGASRPPLRPGRDEQRPGESTDALQVVSRLLARNAEAAWAAYRWPDARSAQPWTPGWEDGVARVATGIPARMDRLHGLGNAVVPEIPRRLGVAIGRARATLTARAA